MRPACLEIDLNALKHNVAVVRSLAPYQQVMAVIKANGYGHGMSQVAEALQHDVEAFAVTSVDEALQLREWGYTLPIVLLEGFFSRDELALIEQYNLQPVVHQIQQVEQLLEYQTDHRITVWLKLDTGMHRLGFSGDDYYRAYQLLSSATHIQQPVGHMSHFACADDVQHPFTVKQLRQFKQVCDGLQGPMSLANSAAVVAWPETHGDWVRPGVMLYGVSPLLHKTGGLHGLKPVMTLRSALIAIRKISKGDAIGYGSCWRADESCYIGTVAIGYGDGYPRHAVNGTPVKIGTETYGLVGRVSMDMITVNLGRELKVRVGDHVTLWGDGLPVETVAQHSDTIAYELLCGVASRVKRHYEPI